MNIVLDSNILFSALIKDSLTRRLILEYDGFFLFPSFIFEEVEKHKEELLAKSKSDAEELEKLLQLLLKKVLIVPPELLLPFREQALNIVKEIDLDDVIFIACALAYSNSAIWSDDKNLKRQNKVKIVNTKEMMQLN